MGILTDAEKSGDQFHLRFMAIVIENEVSLRDTLAEITEIDAIDQTLNQFRMNKNNH